MTEALKEKEIETRMPLPISSTEVLDGWRKEAAKRALENAFRGELSGPLRERAFRRAMEYRMFAVRMPSDLTPDDCKIYEPEGARRKDGRIEVVIMAATKPRDEFQRLSHSFTMDLRE